MPFTPFHMGAGLALKAVAGRHFSVLTFGMAQVAMDIEPLVRMMRGAAVLHGPTHTYLGAVPIALATAALAPWLCHPLLRRWNREVQHHRVEWLHENELWRPRTVLLGALAGTWSHVLLDSVMHADITPWAPWSGANGLYAWVSLSTLHGLCVAGMVVGAVTVLVWQHFQWFKLYEIVPGFALSAIAIVVFSLLDKQPSTTMQATHSEVEAEIAAHGE